MAAHVPTTAGVRLRPPHSDDAQECGRICFEAFGAISGQHNFPNDFPNVEAATGVVGMLIEHPQFYGLVAERDGRVVGSNFLDERNVIAGVGPITVDPSAQNRGVGRQLMQGVLDRAAERRFAGVRLVQAGYHARSFSLYTSLGFQVRETLACVQGEAKRIEIPGRSTRVVQERDLDACNAVSLRVHGHTRAGELADAVRAGTATLVEHGGRVTGYSTAVAFFGHTVGETDDDVKALIGDTPVFAGPGFLVPARSPLVRWCLEQRYRVEQLLTLMSIGLYNEPKGAFLPSILY
ncbi:MAG: GNAT family N-acetyltransferase [Chloroflexota bacterium]